MGETDTEGKPKDDIQKLQEYRKKLKQQSVSSDYEDKIASKLGGKTGVNMASAKMKRSIRGLDEAKMSMSSTAGENQQQQQNQFQLGRQDQQYGEGDFDDDGEISDEDLEEEELVDLVAQKLAEKKAADLLLQKQRDEEMRMLRQKERVQQSISDLDEESYDNSELKKATSGVGGSWAPPPDQQQKNETLYTPARGSWGVFPRPQSISKTYGGGRQIGAGVDKTDLLKSTEETKKRLQEYREKMGIEVQSEKDNAQLIEDALQLGQRAMQRGLYTTAVSALEKVTKYCSTNSKVGGQVFLELAMAYEASGKTDEAIYVYTTLTKSRIENIKFNAKKLLYGIEAMNFMRNDIKSDSFQRKKTTQTFIDTTGLSNFANNFDDRYETAYVDLSKQGGFYKSLTENVVRTFREARQILLSETQVLSLENNDSSDEEGRKSGEKMNRLRVVQAIRTMARNFDDELSLEIQRKVKEQEEENSEAVIDGVSISMLRRSKEASLNNSEEFDARQMDKFRLASPSQMLENLNGEWKLQLMADKKGDSTTYLTNSDINQKSNVKNLTWKNINTQEEKFEFFCGKPNGLFDMLLGGAGSYRKQGQYAFDPKRRILLLDPDKAPSPNKSGPIEAGMAPHQIIVCDSTLLVTRKHGLKISPVENVKDFYCVWRKVENGTFTKKP